MPRCTNAQKYPIDTWAMDAIADINKYLLTQDEYNKAQIKALRAKMDKSEEIAMLSTPHKNGFFDWDFGAKKLQALLATLTYFEASRKKSLILSGESFE